MGIYNRMIVIAALCLLTGWLAYLRYPVEQIMLLQEKLVYLAGVYVVGKEINRRQGL